VLGLLIGSFLNVVIYRTPVMMYREWLADAVANLMSSKDAPSLVDGVRPQGRGARRARRRPRTRPFEASWPSPLST
jgi:prepilin signal peptidase PulO-like enzyme (type II secretory pathway)